MPILPLLLGALLAGPVWAERSYSPDEILTWQQRSFAGLTDYRLVADQLPPRLHARCDNSASALYLRQRIDLEQTPILEWSWAVDQVFAGTNERSKAGDDYPVRLYVVIDGGLRPWRTRAVNYVWSSHQPIGSHWPNAFTRQAMMLALRSGPASQPGELVSEQRNVREDFLALHGQAPRHIDGLAIMTDCDNSGQPTQGWYGTIRWRATSSSTPR